MSRNLTVVLHDSFVFRGGGERLALIAAQGLAADLVFGAWCPVSYPLAGLAGQAIDLGVRMSVPVARVFGLAYAFWNFGKQLGSYDVRLFSGNNSPLAVLRAPEMGRNVFYCHTPPRHIYQSMDYYRNRSAWLPRVFASGLQSLIRPQYEEAVRRMDVIIANSRCVQQRIRRYLGRESVIVYPPCDTRRFRWIAEGDYYLSMARLDPLKRVDRLVRAFREMPYRRLVVASTGSDAARLRAIAGDASNIAFVGAVEDGELARLVGGALATIYIPENEDFGMSAVESMAAGKPVIGVTEGGIPESVIDGETGLLLPANPGAEHIIAAVEALTPGRARSMRKACEARASRFAVDRFLRELKAVLHEGQ